MSKSGQTDSGVSSRMFGTFLSWLNDHTSDVFVVCTANDVSNFVTSGSIGANRSAHNNPPVAHNFTGHIANPKNICISILFAEAEFSGKRVSNYITIQQSNLPAILLQHNR